MHPVRPCGARTAQTARGRWCTTLCAKGAPLNRDMAISFSVAAVLGAVIWGLSPLLTDAVEPWDAESPYYFLSLFVAGGLVGLLCPKQIWVAYLGIVVGQLVYMLIALPSGPLLPLGVLFLFGYGVLSLLGLALASQVRRKSGSVDTGGLNGT